MHQQSSEPKESSPSYCHPTAMRWVLAATILGSTMAFIDSTVVNVALPVLQSQLNASVTDVQWVVESYALFVGALILVGGALGDRLGRRRFFLAGVGLFAIASLACGLAQNVQHLILARGLQGIGGALLIPGSLAIINAAFPPGERGRAIGLWSGFTAITTAAGPVLGGWLIENLSWRWIFLINLPLSLIVSAISLRWVPESRDEEATGRLDGLGAALVVLGLGSLVFGLLESAHRGLADPLVIGTILAGLLILGGFLWVEAHTTNPMMPLVLFRSSAFSGSNGLTFLLYAALGGALFFLPFNLIQVQGYSPTAAGAAIVPFPVLMFLLSRWSGGLVSRFGARRPLMIGPAIAALGFALMIRPGIGGSYWTTFFPAVVVLGLGMAVSVAPLTTTVMGSVPNRFSGTASGVNNAVSRVATLLAIALLGLLVLAIFTASLNQRLATLQLPPPAQDFLQAQIINLAAAQVPPDLSADQQAAVQQAIDQSFVAGFRVAMGVAAGLAIASSGVAAFTLGSRRDTEGFRI